LSFEDDINIKFDKKIGCYANNLEEILFQASNSLERHIENVDNIRKIPHQIYKITNKINFQSKTLNYIEFKSNFTKELVLKSLMKNEIEMKSSMKNEIYLKNEYIKGTPDLYKGESIEKATIIRDTKSSWDAYSFFRSKAKSLYDMYYYQGTGYMWLTGAERCSIDYCLNNTPWSLILRELYKESFNHIDNKTPNWIELQIIANHVYDKKRLKHFGSLEILQNLTKTHRQLSNHL